MIATAVDGVDDDMRMNEGGVEGELVQKMQKINPTSPNMGKWDTEDPSIDGQSPCQDAGLLTEELR